MPSLRAQLIRLAYVCPDIRGAILPLLLQERDAVHVRHTAGQMLLSEIPPTYKIPNSVKTWGLNRGSPILGEWLNKALASFTKHNADLKDPESSYQMCWDVTQALSEHLTEWDIPNRIIRLDTTTPSGRRSLPYTVPTDLRGDHRINAVGSYRIDYTASQFQQGLPFPVIWKT